MSQIQTTNQTAPAAIARPIDVGTMMQAIVDKGITGESVAVMKDLLNMQREMNAEAAKVAFNRAFVALQRDCKPIAANKMIPGKGGEVRSHYATYQEIRSAVDPLLDRHGFGIDFDHKREGPMTTVTCTLTHRDGHERSRSYTTRGVVAPSNNDAQNDTGTNTTACRVCLCNVLGIVIIDDQDARNLGDYISEAEAAKIEARVAAVYPDPADVARFLRFAGAERFSEIRTGKLTAIDAALSAKEGKQAAGKPQPSRTDATKPQATAPEVIDRETGEVVTPPFKADEPPSNSPWADLNAWRRECDERAKARGLAPDALDAGMRAALKSRGWTADFQSDVAFREKAIEAIQAGRFDPKK